jgi:hypothetical protein
MEEAHTPEESVNFAQVLKSAEIYLNSSANAILVVLIKRTLKNACVN